MKTILNLFKSFLQIILIQAFIFSIPNILSGNDRAVWATAWEINSPEKIDQMLSDLQKHKFNKLFLQIRYRGDALYKPNRFDSTFLNLEKRSYILGNSLFDPLDYAIQKAKPLGIKVFAWVTTFVITPHDLNKLQNNHVFYTHPEWLLKTKTNQVIGHNQYEGAFLDPALPEVRQYTLNILSDIVTNYQIDGIQLDYIRYPDTLYGWNSESIQLANSNPDFNFNEWKKQKITSFVNLTYISLKNIKPEIEISVAAINEKSKAAHKYAQEWWLWTDDNIIDRVYVMAYNSNNASFQHLIKSYESIVNKEKITIILRAWQEEKPYHVSQINNKLSFLKSHGYNNIGYYHYSGLKTNNYLNQIRY